MNVLLKGCYWFLLWVFLSYSLQLFSQNDFRPGFIITTEGDTIYGEIDYRGDQLMHKRCKFREDSDVKRFYPNEIAAYRFTDSKFYISKKLKEEKVFLEYIINGKVNIYYLRDDTGDHYLINRDSLELREMTYEESVLELDQSLYLYESTRHMGLLFYYMQDAPKLRSRIKAIKVPGHKNLTKLALDYHNTVCKNEQCIIYEKKQTKTEVNIEVVSGIVNFENLEGLNDISYLQTGIFGTVTIPRTNEKLILKTGLLYARPQVFNVKDSKLKIPVHIGYMAPKRFNIRPTVSIGLLSPSYSGGLSIKVTERFRLGVQSWFNFHRGQSFWAPKELFNYSILGSLSIRL